MRIFFTIITLLTILTLEAQQISVSEIARSAKWDKLIDEVNNGKQKIKYSDIDGIPYYSAGFVNARVGDTSASVPIRYNTFLDTIEIVANNDVYEIPREESYPKFTFEDGKTLVLVNTRDEFAGYFFEIASGKNRILKKVITKFHDAVPAPNSMIPGTSAKFETLKPIYFIKNDNGMVRIPKNTKDLVASFPHQKDSLNEFLQNNKIKLNHEPDLVKLAQFLNK